MALSLAITPLALRTTHAPAPKAVAIAKTEFCYGLPGNIAPAGDFDPANLLEGVPKEEVYRWREAELTHGRVGMLASAGFLVQENFHPLFSGDGGPAIQQIPALPPVMWFLMTLGVGIAESYRVQVGWANPYEDADGNVGRANSANVQKLKDSYYPGDLRFDPLNLAPTDPAEFREMQEKELSHGRLAMLAAAGFMAQEAVTGKTWGEQDNIFERLIFGGWLDAAAVDLAGA